MDVLEETRQEAMARYGSGAAYFQDAIAPVYNDLVDALLRGAAALPEPDESDVLLLEARDAMERFKAAELRDYFRNECVAELTAKETALEQAAGSAAVVYPILLPDRVEVLVSLPSGMRRFRTDVAAAAVDETARRFRKQLQNPASDDYRATGQQLYDWLVRPFAAELAKQEIETLVFVPGGILRTIPMAALHDGSDFLVERYALAVTPGLRLVDPRPLDRTRTRLLLAGLSESVQGFSALEMVPAELEAVQALYGGDVLLNDEFRVDRVEREVADEEPTVVHLASHAVFTGDPDTSFLLTHDGRLTMDRMAEIVGRARFREEPLELLVLSACETAAGDERAALGLAGVAIRAGARSAVGSLWSISDEAAKVLVVDFYTRLKDPTVSRAAALQGAQRSLLASQGFAHPFYWSPFLLISDWL